MKRGNLIWDDSGNVQFIENEFGKYVLGVDVYEFPATDDKPKGYSINIDLISDEELKKLKNLKPK